VRWSLDANAATLTVESAPGVPITVDGESAGVAPLRLELTAGAHRVEIASPCYESARADVTLARGSTKAISLKAQVRTGGLRVELTDAKGDAVEGDVTLDGSAVGRTWKNLTVPVCGKVVEVATARGQFREEVSLRAKDVVRVEGALSANAEDDDACPFVKGNALKTCETSFKSDMAACDSAQKEAIAACTESRQECLEAERAARGIGPAAPSTCGSAFQRCSATAKRARALCGAAAGDTKGTCTDAVETRAARCAVALAGSSKERKSACQAQCRADATAAVNACNRTTNAEKRVIADRRDADRAECSEGLTVCNQRIHEHCSEDYNDCLQLAEYLANDVRPSAQSCIAEVQKGVLPCVRACEAP
jgi:hypothetical protein